MPIWRSKPGGLNDYRLACGHALDALRFDNSNVESNIIAARFAIFEMLGPQDWGTTLEKVEGDIEAYVEERADEAIDHLSRVLGFDPDHIPARLLLGLVYYENEMFHRLVGLFEDYRRRMPDRSEPYFLFALALASQSDGELARIAYAHGLNRLEQGDPYWIAGLMFAGKTSCAGDIGLETLTNVWAPYDPLMLTSSNERLMEHYQRVA